MSLEPGPDFDLRDGDLLFQDLAGRGATAIEVVSPGFNGAEVSHVGIHLWIGTVNYVVEAFPPEVRLTPLPVYLRRARDELDRPRVFVGRLKPEYEHLIPDAVEEALSMRGLPYDRVYLTGEDAYYCSELVVDAFKYANGGAEVFPEHPMSFRDPATGAILDYWVSYYRYFGRPVPEGEPGSNPGELSMSDKIEVLHRYGFLTNWR
ncbi:MAG: YiiX/YebB-like N1pC/P60 family cysteine hydrolase [Polyangiaceae bacterium]